MSLQLWPQSCENPVKTRPLIIMSLQTKSSARTITVVRPLLCDFCDPGGNKVWIDAAFFDSARQFYFALERKKKHTPRATAAILLLYLTYKLWPTFIFDLQALTYLYTWPASSDLPLYLTCQLWPTVILDLQAEVCTAPCVGHRDPIEPRCSLCGDVGHDDKARGPEHYGLVRPTDTLQSDAVWLRLGAASGVFWRPQEGEGQFRWRWECCDVKADRHWISVESHLTNIFISSRGACVADMLSEICKSKQVKQGKDI